MMNATREKTRLWLLILVGVVATLLGQTHAREIFAPSPHESGIFAEQTQASTGENYDACQYDTLDSLLAAKGLADLPGKGKPGWTKLKGDQGWKDADGNMWNKDKLHKDHWDVSDKKGNKIREVDYDGNQIWPGGPKNKNK